MIPFSFVFVLYFLSLFTVEVKSASGQSSSSKEVHHQPTFKDQVPRALHRNPSLQHHYASTDYKLNEVERVLSTDKKQTLIHKYLEPREQTPTRRRVAIHRQKSYENMKKAEHELNALADIGDHEARNSFWPTEHKAFLQIGSGGVRHAVKFAGKKAKQIANNPNSPSTSHLVKYWEESKKKSGREF